MSTGPDIPHMHPAPQIQFAVYVPARDAPNLGHKRCREDASPSDSSSGSERACADDSGDSAY